MKITNDRLAVAWAVQEHIEFLMGESFDLYPEEVIAAIPEPPDDSPATLPRVEGAIVATQAVIVGLLQRRADVARLTGHQSAEALLDARQEVLELDTAAIARDLGALSGQPEPLPAPTGPGLWWMFDTRAPHAGWRGQNVFTDTWFGKQQLVIRSPGFEDKPREGQLWVGPLVAPTAKGGAE